MKFGKLELNPAKNPGVLDTATWDPAAAWRWVAEARCDWGLTRSRLAKDTEAQIRSEGIVLHGPSVAELGPITVALATLPDAQEVLLQFGGGDLPLRCDPLGKQPLASGGQLCAYPADAAVLERYCRLFKPDKASRRLGGVPRLGVGSRMTTSVWPGTFLAMTKKEIAANSIQNSVRELNLLENLRQGAPPEKSYATGIGTVECGWAGSTYEGLWLAGVLAGLKWDGKLQQGSDADHVQVKRGPDGLARAKRVLQAARHYSFYTLDMADVLNYGALQEASAAAEALLAANIPDPVDRLAVLECHTKDFKLGKRVLKLAAADVGRFVGKYWETLGMLDQLASYIASLKEQPEFDLELTIDEHPPEVAAFDCLTTDEEVLFLAREIARRRLPVTHLAPNFGQEKGCDYRCPDGLEGLERRAQAQHRIAREFGLLLDVHSGDDLTRGPRRVFQRAMGGELHFKVSPHLQLIYAELLQEHHPELFQRWWEDAVAYAQREAAQGSPVAQRCLAELPPRPQRSWRDAVFHHFSFPFVGKRDASGQFLHRQEFYELSPAFNQSYQVRVCDYLCELAEDLFQP